jgi:hypothetical protein
VSDTRTAVFQQSGLKTTGKANVLAGAKVECHYGDVCKVCPEIR